MIDVVPAAIPATSPEVFTVAIPVDEEVHMPPVVVLLSVVVVPGHTWVLPAIAAGNALTVTADVW
jgi:hypothetical protein